MSLVFRTLRLLPSGFQPLQPSLHKQVAELMIQPRRNNKRYQRRTNLSESTGERRKTVTPRRTLEALNWHPPAPGEVNVSTVSTDPRPRSDAKTPSSHFYLPYISTSFSQNPPPYHHHHHFVMVFPSRCHFLWSSFCYHGPSDHINISMT